MVPLSKEHLLEIAHKAMTKVREKIFCSHQIVSRFELPEMLGSQMSEYKLRFGEEKINQLINHFTLLNIIRNESDIAVEKLQITQSPGATSVFAVSLLGLGESQELTLLAAHELRMLGLSNISLVVVMPYDKTKIKNTHAFLVINGTGHVQAGDHIDSFKSCSNSLIFDPVLGEFFFGSEHNNVFAEHIRLFQCTEISSINILSNTNFHEFYNNALQVVIQIVKTQLNRFCFTDQWKYTPNSAVGSNFWMQDDNKSKIENTRCALVASGIDPQMVSIRKAKTGPYILLLSAEPESLRNLHKIVNKMEFSVINDEVNAAKKRFTL